MSDVLAERTRAPGYHQLRVHALMVVGPGEADRWLDACLSWVLPMVDTLYVYDDRSADADGGSTQALIADHADRDHRLMRGLRGADEPGFLDHEGRFRGAAWAAFQQVVGPAEGDWVLLLDADEFPVPDHRLVGGRAAIQASAWFADQNGQEAVAVEIPEIWGMQGAQPLARTDGRWAGNAGPRLVRWIPGATEFPDRAMGCGSLPVSYIERQTGGGWDLYGQAFFRILHYGYLHPDDVAAKWERYSSRAHGHADDHIQSIARPPQVKPLAVSIAPTIWRGRR